MVSYDVLQPEEDVGNGNCANLCGSLDDERGTVVTARPPDPEPICDHILIIEKPYSVPYVCDEPNQDLGWD
jgi:hypothetical protein